MAKVFKVVSAQYIKGYKLRVLFNDHTWQQVDFEPFLFAYSRGYYDKYRRLPVFKKFRIDEGNLVWGKNWDLIFPIEELYRGKIRFNKKRITQSEFDAYINYPSS